MSNDEICGKIEKGMQELLDEGRTVVKASEIAERGEIKKSDGNSPGWRVGSLLALGMCGDFDEVRYEILSNDDEPNDYRLWKR